MKRKIRRILSMALLLALIITICPAPAHASSVSAAQDAQLKQQVRDLYRACQRGAGRYSFFGYCGTMVGWELYALGITDKLVAVNGNQHFDIYANQQYSSGGFRIRAYSAKDYSIREALKLITNDGTEDAYNILVGWNSTPSAAGRYAGHATVITAIVGGTVYFTDSFSVIINGVRYPEGAPVTCTIDEFCDYFAMYKNEDGVIHFGVKTYAESCTYYPAYLQAAITEETTLNTAPCQVGVDERCTALRTLQSGERVQVVGLYCNTLGEYWYEVEESEKGYIRADKTEVLSMCYEDLTVSNLEAPGELRQGRGFDLRGKLQARYNQIYTVRAQVFSYEGGTQSHVMSATENLYSSSYSLYQSQLSSDLAFRKLPLGNYRFELAAVVGNNYYADGQLQTEWKTVKLWRGDFAVVSRQGSTYQVKFDADGGETTLNSAYVSIGDSLNVLPEATREGFQFDGWYTTNGTPITENTVIAADANVIAYWIDIRDFEGWRWENGGWSYYENGEAVTGFVRSGPITYYVQADGTLASGWKSVDGKLYYFHGNGTMQLGWMQDPDAQWYYFTASGAAVGWMTIEDVRYYFNDDGVMQTGTIEIDGLEHRFDENGAFMD